LKPAPLEREEKRPHLAEYAIFFGHLKFGLSRYHHNRWAKKKLQASDENFHFFQEKSRFYGIIKISKNL
jgi:hypothetical protein